MNRLVFEVIIKQQSLKMRTHCKQHDHTCALSTERKGQMLKIFKSEVLETLPLRQSERYLFLQQYEQMLATCHRLSELEKFQSKVIRLYSVRVNSEIKRSAYLGKTNYCQSTMNRQQRSYSSKTNISKHNDRFYRQNRQAEAQLTKQQCMLSYNREDIEERIRQTRQQCISQEQKFNGQEKQPYFRNSHTKCTEQKNQQIINQLKKQNSQLKEKLANRQFASYLKPFNTNKRNMQSCTCKRITYLQDLRQYDQQQKKSIQQLKRNKIQKNKSTKENQYSEMPYIQHSRFRQLAKYLNNGYYYRKPSFNNKKFQYNDVEIKSHKISQNKSQGIVKKSESKSKNAQNIQARGFYSRDDIEEDLLISSTNHPNSKSQCSLNQYKYTLLSISLRSPVVESAKKQLIKAFQILSNEPSSKRRTEQIENSLNNFMVLIQAQAIQQMIKAK